jgi:hypothetical protein
MNYLFQNKTFLVTKYFLIECICITSIITINWWIIIILSSLNIWNVNIESIPTCPFFKIWKQHVNFMLSLIRLNFHHFNHLFFLIFSCYSKLYKILIINQISERDFNKYFSKAGTEDLFTNRMCFISYDKELRKIEMNRWFDCLKNWIHFYSRSKWYMTLSGKSNNFLSFIIRLRVR